MSVGEHFNAFDQCFKILLFLEDETDQALSMQLSKLYCTAKSNSNLQLLLFQVVKYDHDPRMSLSLFRPLS